MRIKGTDGHDYNVTGQGQGTYNTVAGSAGLASFLGLDAKTILNGWNGNRNGCSMNACDTPVSRYEAAMMQEIANKDGKIALLEANIYTDQKIADVYERLNVKINANKEAQDAVNLQQAVLNATQTATIACMKGQIEQLAALAQFVIPSRNVCDTGCGCNG
jgi:hypothetical protein